MTLWASLVALCRRAGAILAVFYAYMVEFRAELLLWALANSLPFILMGAWYEAAGRGSFSLTPVEVVRYFLAVFVVRQLTVVWVIWEMEQDILRGRLAHMLLQPLDPVWRYVAAHLGERLARLPFTFVLIGLFFVLYPAALFVPEPAPLLWGLWFSTLAFVLRFVLQHTLGMLSFWTERASSIESLFFTLYLFLSGAIAPLEFFPVEVKDALLYTPFPYFIWVPATLLVGQTPDAFDPWRATLVVGAWCAGLVVLNRVLWRRGLRRHSAMGA